MTPAKLLVSLSSSGVHIIPSDTDFEDSKLLTDSAVEDVFCSDVALMSTSFDIKASRYNSKRVCGNLGVFQVKESNALKGIIDPFPMHLMKIEVDSTSKDALEAPGSKLLPQSMRNVRYNVLEGEELCDEVTVEEVGCPEKTKEGSRSSASPFVCLKPFSSDEAMERIQSHSHLEVETVKQLLKLIRPLPFC